MCGCLGEAGLATDGLVRAQSSKSRLQPALACNCDNRDSRRYGHAGATAWHPIGLVTAYCIYLPGSASHPPRARPECGETAKEAWREPAMAEADITEDVTEVMAVLGSTS